MSAAPSDTPSARLERADANFRRAIDHGSPPRVSVPAVRRLAERVGCFPAEARAAYIIWLAGPAALPLERAIGTADAARVIALISLPYADAIRITEVIK